MMGRISSVPVLGFTATNCMRWVVAPVLTQAIGKVAPTSRVWDTSGLVTRTLSWRPGRGW